ncbi:MAG TPA: PQQ-binding-like beta-propeller repeat protein [Gammaproteobacteria bacterium]
MHNRRIVGLAAMCLPLWSVAPAWGQEGADLYRANCAACHDAGLERAPSREAFEAMAPERILDAMEKGTMISMALTMSHEQRRTLAEYLAGEPLSAALSTEPPASAMCRERGARLVLDGPRWMGFGPDTRNQRFQTADAAGLTAADVPRLAVKWAFGFPGDDRVNMQAAIVGDRVFIGSFGGYVYSLDAQTGCIHWYYDADASVRSGLTVAEIEHVSGRRLALFFGDQRGYAHALDAATGERLWSVLVDDFPVARVTGTPAFHEGRLYVPVASNEEGAAAVATYECCRFRGSLVALDAATGRQVWKTYTVPEPKPTKKNAVGAQLWGPSGAPIWSSPAIDPVRNAVYVTTGNNYSDPATELSDAFVAMDLDTGRILWSRQMTENDAWTAACRMVDDKTNCAEANGPDFDFGASPMLVDLGNDRRALVAGQKSGVVHALDPDREGAILWQRRIGRGGSMGGVQWGTATDGVNVYAALSDVVRIPVPFAWATEADPNEGGGMFALRLSDGEQVWYTPPGKCGDRPRCSPAQPGAVAAIPGVVFSGSMDGHVRAYSTENGKILWDFDTVRDFQTVNGVPARGGSLDGPGITIGAGLVLVNSGYPNGGGIPGNVLIAFSPDGR